MARSHRPEAIRSAYRSVAEGAAIRTWGGHRAADRTSTIDAAMRDPRITTRLRELLAWPSKT